MRIILSLIMMLPYSAFAFFCPNNFTQIEFGYTIEQIKQACGQPSKEEKKEVEAQAPQEWIYFIQQPALPGNINAQQPPAMLKATINFDQQGKVTYISVNGMGLGSSSFCGTPLGIGATIDQVQSACGKPEKIIKEKPENTGAAEQKTIITEMTYGSGTLIFNNGLLTEKR